MEGSHRYTLVLSAYSLSAHFCRRMSPSERRRTRTKEFHRKTASSSEAKRSCSVEKAYERGGRRGEEVTRDEVGPEWGGGLESVCDTLLVDAITVAG